MGVQKIVIVAGEASGDYLAAGLVKSLLTLYPHCEIRGIAGPRMQAAGVQLLFPASQLSVMGFLEVLPALPRILKIRQQLLKNIRHDLPDIYIGVDAPDFNLPVEAYLKKNHPSIKIVHYVSPKIWTWRKDRINTIAASVDLLLCLFPFEIPIYQKHGVNAHFVGHPLADDIPLDIDTNAARQGLKLNTGKKMIALLPGSRQQEIKQLLPHYLTIAAYIHAKQPNIEFLLPVAHAALNTLIKPLLKDYLSLPVHLFQGQADQVLWACDAVLVTAGTATLQAMLYKKPMVIAYALNPFTYFVVKYFYKIRYYGLPNILANRFWFPEFIQENVQLTEAIGEQLLNYLQAKDNDDMSVELLHWHQQLKQNTNETAAKCVSEMIFSKDAKKII